MELINALQNQYGVNEPIFFDEIARVGKRYTRARIYQLINAALDSGALARFGYDCYYIPTQTPFGQSLLNPRRVIEKKYIQDNGEIFGYYTGMTLLNVFGITTQMPNVIEIYTNNEATKSRRVNINNQTVIVKKARTKIDKTNYRQIMILELFNIMDKDAINSQASQKIIDYMKSNGITIKDVMQYADKVPARAIKNFMRSEVQNEIAYQ